MIHNLAASKQVFTSNVFLVEGERTVLVDPGANFDVVTEIEYYVDELDALVLTHTHPDHVGNTEQVLDEYDIESWGFDAGNPTVDQTIGDGDQVKLGDHEYQALHTPGHKDDHLCFYATDPGVLFAGDLIFQNGGFGRTDLEEGDRAKLVESIERVKNEITEGLDVMHCGHGPSVQTDPSSHIEMALRAARR